MRDNGDGRSPVTDAALGPSNQRSSASGIAFNRKSGEALDAII
jgi:hypothetical protein